MERYFYGRILPRRVIKADTTEGDTLQIPADINIEAITPLEITIPDASR